MDNLLYEILVLQATEQQLYDIFFSNQRGFFEDDTETLYLAVAGLMDPREYERDNRGMLPRWLISRGKKIASPLDTKANLETIIPNPTIAELLITSPPKGVLIKFVGRNGVEDVNLEKFIIKIVDHIKEGVNIDVLFSSFLKGRKPWDQIEGDSNQLIAEWWNEGKQSQEIAKELKKDDGTIRNSISDLRKKYGKEVIPFSRDRVKNYRW